MVALALESLLNEEMSGQKITAVYKRIANALLSESSQDSSNRRIASSIPRSGLHGWGYSVLLELVKIL